MKKTLAILTIPLLLISAIVFYFLNVQKINEIKCQGFTQYNLIHNDSLVRYDVLESVFLFENYNSIIFHGFMYKNERQFTLERKVSLSEPKRIDSDTFSINIESYGKTTNDNISDDDFNNMLSNIGFIGKNLRLDINEIHDGSFILGNSTSYNFICTPYYQ